MKESILSVIAIVMAMTIASLAFAHGDQPHPKCKKGYVPTSDHKCVNRAREWNQIMVPPWTASPRKRASY